MTTRLRFVLPKITESTAVEVLDNCGKLLFTKQYKTIPSNNEKKVPLDNLKRDLFVYCYNKK
jgi:hypothetical protein